MEFVEEFKKAPFWQKLILVSVFGIIAAYVIYVFVVEDKKKELNTLEEEVGKLKSELNTLKAVYNQGTLKNVDEKLKEIQFKNQEILKKIEDMDRVVPKKPEMDSVLHLFSKLASKHKVVISEFKVLESKDKEIILYYDGSDGKVKTLQEAEKKGKEKSQGKDSSQKLPENSIKLRTVDFNFSVTGSSNSLIGFVEEFSKMERIIHIRSIEAKRETGWLKFNVEASTYYKPEDT
ncbi:MAG: hypothetical protein N2Z80_07680 [Hydrogenothermaceae bacterium]|nr:hypothetical protein [Hydrogenothermaceae bacterium]